MIKPKGTALEYILAELGPIAGKVLLDIGCGKGGLSVPLQKAGAVWHGLDPFAEAGDLAIDRAKLIFGCEFANVQPNSGSQANGCESWSRAFCLGHNVDHAAAEKLRAGVGPSSIVSPRPNEPVSDHASPRDGCPVPKQGSVLPLYVRWPTAVHLADLS